MKVDQTGSRHNPIILPVHDRFLLLSEPFPGLWAIFLILLIPTELIGQSIALSPHLFHTPIFVAPAHNNITVRLELEEGAGEIATARLLWRSPSGEYRSADLEYVGGDLEYSIPAGDVQPPYIEYAILVKFSDGKSASYPLVNALTQPQVIAITPVERAAKEGPSFVVLYPRQGEVLYEAEVRIAISVFAPDSSYDPVSTQVFIDGNPAPVEESSPTYLFVKISHLKAGSHDVTLRSFDYQGSVNPDFRWSFRTAAEGEKRPPATLTWSFTGEGSIEDFGGEQEGILRGDFRARGDAGRMKYYARSYLTSEEAWDRQPQNRFMFYLQTRRFHLNLGDTYPQFSDLVLSYRRIRGVELGIHLDKTHILGVYGEIDKAIEGDTYRRDLWGFRPYWVLPNGARFGLSFLKVKDNLSSIDQASSSPKDNLVAGFDVLYPLFRRKLDVNFSMAFSLTAMDIRGGSAPLSVLQDADIDVNFDPEPWEPLLVINESLTPPNPSGLSSLAWVTSMTLRHSGQIFSLSYRNIGPTYYSLGNPYLQNDLSGWNLSDQFYLFDRRLFVNLGLDQQQDNLRGTKCATTASFGTWVTLAYYPPSYAPQVTLTLNYRTGGNDITSVDSTLTESQTLYVDQRRDEGSGTANLSISQQLFLFDRRHVLTLSYNESQFQDNVSSRPPDFADLNSSSRNYGAVWRTELSNRLSVALDYSFYSSETAVLPFEYHQFGGLLTGSNRNRMIRYSLAGHRRSGDQNLSRWQGDIFGEWEFYPDNRVRGEASRYFNDNVQDEGIYRLYYFKRF